MGERFESIKREDFNHGKDMAIQKELATNSLFSGVPMDLSRSVTCLLPDVTALPKVGDHVILLQSGSDFQVILPNSFAVAGSVPYDEDRKYIVGVMESEPRAQGMTEWEVVECGAIAPEVKVQILIK